MGGGDSEKTMASRSCDSAIVPRNAMAEAASRGPRSPQSFSVTKASAAFWPWPKKEKPRTVTIRDTPGSAMKCFSAASIAAMVRFTVASDGAWKLTMM